jgi:hypothetical protein
MHPALRLLLTRTSLDSRRVRHFVISLESFWREAPWGRCLCRIILFPDHDKLLDQHRHVGSVLSCLLRTCLPLRFEALPGKRVGDQPIAVQSGESHRLLAVGRGQDRDRLEWRIVKSALHVRRDKAALFQWVQAPPGEE